MRSLVTFILLSSLVGLMALSSGCKEDAPMSELDRFVAWSTGLERDAMVDTLQTIITAGGDQAKYANYVMGNYIYEQAADSAAVYGWGEAPVPGMLDIAETYLAAAVESDTTFVEALVNLGSLWDDRSQQISVREDRIERMKNAEDYYKRALRIDPSDEKARCNLGGLYLRKRRTQEAMDEFQKALEYNPDSALAHYNMAIVFAESKIYREAIVEWEKAVDKDKDGDIGARSRENIKIVKELMNAPVPDNVQ